MGLCSLPSVIVHTPFRAAVRAAVFSAAFIAASLPSCIHARADACSFAVFGDSYSDFDAAEEGHYYPGPSSVKGNDVLSEEDMWYMILEKKTGGKLVCNESLSGSELSANSGYGAKSFLARLDSLDAKGADVCFLQGGCNDVWLGRSIGVPVYEDFSSADLTQFAPALSFLFHELCARYPDTKFIYMVCGDYFPPEWCAMADEIAAHYGVDTCYFLDASMHEWHPDRLGMAQIAEVAADEVSESLPAGRDA